jgi:FixJ family two-component response regulator
LFSHLPIPRADADLGPLPGLKALRGARGVLYQEFDEVLRAARGLGWRVSDPALPDIGAAEMAKDQSLARVLQTLVARMEAVEKLLDHSVKPEGEPAPERTAIQIVLVQIFVKSMKIELALAKLEASVRATVDFSVLGRAIENIGELTTDFLVTVRGIASKMTVALREASERLLRPGVRRIARGFQTVIEKVSSGLSRQRSDRDLSPSAAPGEFPKPVSERPTVLVVDPDVSVREGLRSLFQSVGLDVRLFASAPEMLRQRLPDASCCLVLETRLPGVSGLDFQTQLTNADVHIPIVMVSGYGDIAMSVRAMKAGAIDFLTKPFREEEMLDAVVKAIERDRKRRENEKAVSEQRRLFETLTSREREIMSRVAAGLLNKQIAAELGLSEVTVKILRGRVMKKMSVRSLAELIRAAEILDLRSQRYSARAT